MKRRFTAVCLCFLMVASLLPLSSFAANSTPITSNVFAPPAGATAQMEKEISYLEEIGLLSDKNGSLVDATITNTTPAYSGAAATIEYTIDYDLFKEIVSFTDFSDSKIGMLVYSEDRSVQNTLEITDSNTMYANGTAVASSSTLSIGDSGLVSPYASDRWFQTSCPYGSSTDYTVSAGITRIDNIPLVADIIDMTFSLVYQAVCLAAGVDTIFADAFTSLVFASLQATYPESRGISCIDGKYWHKSCSSSSGGYISAYGAYVTSHAINWYPRINAQGTPTFTREYEVHVVY